MKERKGGRKEGRKEARGREREKGKEGGNKRFVSEIKYDISDRGGEMEGKR